MFKTFQDCSGLTSVTIPNSVTSIENDAFFGCSSLNTVKVPVTDYSTFCANKALGCIYSSLGKPVQLIDSEGKEITEYIVPDGVTSIGSSAFLNCTGLTAITIAGSVTSIGSYAFSGCSGLNTVKVPVTDYSAFCTNKALGCIYSSIGKPVQLIDSEGKEITEYIVPEGVTSIGNSAFVNCTGLTAITIAGSVTSIGSDAFSSCSSLNTVKVPVTDYSSFCTNKALGCIYSSLGKPVQLIDSEGKEITEYIVPDGVTSIESSAFRNCTGLTAITIAGSVTSIGSNAFSGCTSLNSVKVSVTDYLSFCNNKALGGIYSSLGKPVQLIDSAGKEISEFIVPEGVTSIGNSAFVNCTGLTAITIAGSVTSLGSNAFQNCSGLTSITIPNSVTSIGGSAFYACSSLSSVTIPGSVMSIGWGAFYECTSLMSVKSYITEPFNISRFTEETYRNGTLFVPAGTKDLYIRFDGWREFLKIEEMTAEPAPNGQCATPNIMIAGRAFKFSCETPDAEFESILTTEEHFTGDVLPMENREIVYTLTVYATAPGYDRSEPAKLSFNVDRADINQDGSIDVADIATIIDRMAGKARLKEETEEE